MLPHTVISGATASTKDEWREARQVSIKKYNTTRFRILVVKGTKDETNA